MATIKAPFNFVPLSEHVFFPEWADQISQDIPFSDGISGTIDLTITAESPIFVRNGHTRDDAEQKNETYKSFSKTNDGRYFIPATSIKGAIRNVLEIMSFGKMSHISNNRYSIRDLKQKKYMSCFGNEVVHCGWLSKKEDCITITDNGIPRRISHEDIDKKYGTNFCDIFTDSEKLKSDKYRSAIFKIKNIGTQDLHISFVEVPLNPKNDKDHRIQVAYSDKKDAKSGTIVLTGQPGVRKPAERSNGVTRKATGKYYEFVFLDEIINTYTIDTYEENNIYKDFCFVYKDSEEWEYWKKILKDGGDVPIFFSLRNNQILHFGLSYLYKLPFNKRINEYLPAEHKKEDNDLCECILGCSVRKTLKGRVQFSNAFCKERQISQIELKPYMGSPKPTYYPIYIKQKNIGEYLNEGKRGHSLITMLDNDAQLRGWKRYPIQKKWKEIFDDVPEDQQNNTSPFYPMNKGSEFVCRISFHNLKEIELGALLCATLLREGNMHSVGFAKAFGYGKIRIRINDFLGRKMDGTVLHRNDIDNIKNTFGDFISNKIEDYKKLPQINELNLMMHEQNTYSPLEYMDLKEYMDCKKNGESLQDYSLLVRKEIPQKKENVYAEAKVSFWDNRTKLAKLKEGKEKDKPYLLEVNSNIRLRIGDNIKVKIVSDSGRIRKLVFCSIVK